MTLSELCRMADAREESEWNQTALIAAILENSNRDPEKRKRPFSPSDFNPYAKPVEIKKLTPSQSRSLISSILKGNHSGRES